MQSDPEDLGGSKKCRSKRKADKRKANISGPLDGSKSVGRLDGLKQVSLLHTTLDIFYNPLDRIIGERRLENRANNFKPYGS